jgi:Sulfotransferase family
MAQSMIRTNLETTPPQPPAFPHPVFTGGTGRSGTTITATLIARHSRFAGIPREVRFHADGLPDLLAGRRKKTWFIKRLRQYWYFRVLADGTERGLWNIVPPPEFEHAVESFDARYESDPVGAARRLVRDCLDTYARRLNRPAWVEHTPTNIEAAPTLRALFPSARIVHMVRDGRDVACSVPRFDWGPDTMSESLDWWAGLIRRAYEGAAAAPDGSVLVIRLEDLVRDRRDETYAKLLAFLELPDEPGMRAWFDANITDARARLGRWRSELEPAAQEELNSKYRRVVDELHSAGIHVPSAT